MDTIDSGQSIYSGLNAELVLSGHSIQDGDCPMFSHLVGFRALASIGWPDCNGVLSSWVGSSRWGNPLKGLEIMKYFNLRYECLDAKDDYSAKRNKQSESGINFQWATSEMLDDLKDLYDAEIVIYNGNKYDHADSDTLNIPGLQGKAKMYKMMAAERTMKQSGWLDECEDGSPDVGQMENLDKLRMSLGGMGRTG